jgi:hypothetical protein
MVDVKDESWVLPFTLSYYCTCNFHADDNDSRSGPRSVDIADSEAKRGHYNPVYPIGTLGHKNHSSAVALRKYQRCRNQNFVDGRFPYRKRD